MDMVKDRETLLFYFPSNRKSCIRFIDCHMYICHWFILKLKVKIKHVLTQTDIDWIFSKFSLAVILSFLNWHH